MHEVKYLCSSVLSVAKSRSPERQETSRLRPSGSRPTPTAPQGDVTAYAFDVAGRKTTITDGPGDMPSYAYNDAGLLTGIGDVNFANPGSAENRFATTGDWLASHQPGWR